MDASKWCNVGEEGVRLVRGAKLGESALVSKMEQQPSPHHMLLFSYVAYLPQKATGWFRHIETTQPAFIQTP